MDLFLIFIGGLLLFLAGMFSALAMVGYLVRNGYVAPPTRETPLWATKRRS